MGLSRAIGLGIFGWILIFIEVSIFQIGLAISGIHQWIIHYILIIPISTLIAWLYYRKGDKVNGFLLGFIFLVTGIVIDAIITVPLFMQGQYTEFFIDPFLWLGFIEMIIVVGIYDIGIRK
jgi:hypothetical protein